MSTAPQHLDGEGPGSVPLGPVVGEGASFPNKGSFSSPPLGTHTGSSHKHTYPLGTIEFALKPDCQGLNPRVKLWHSPLCDLGLVTAPL